MCERLRQFHNLEVKLFSLIVFMSFLTGAKQIQNGNRKGLVALISSPITRYQRQSHFTKIVKFGEHNVWLRDKKQTLSNRALSVNYWVHNFLKALEEPACTQPNCRGLHKKNIIFNFQTLSKIIFCHFFPTFLAKISVM